MIETPREDKAPTASDDILSPLAIARYQRQMVLPELGLGGQRRLLESRILVIGAGALGSAAATYLALAGVGTLGIVDGDRVDLSNLHRQILHAASDVGRDKTESAAARLNAINPDVRVVQHHTFLARDNARDLVAEYDIIVNGSDNFPTRYLLNDAAVMVGRPVVDAAILRFEGQLTVFQPGQGCYRCLFPEPPPPGTVPSCAEAGVLGAMAGVLGSMQAVEAIKIATGMGTSAAGRFLIFDALRAEWRQFAWRRNPACAVCGDAPTITELVDYEAFCGVPGPEAELPPELAAYELTPEEAARRREVGYTVLDVREPLEWTQLGHIPGAIHQPLHDVAASDAVHLKEPVLCVCAMGQRSRKAAEALRSRGVEAYSLAGGLVAWLNQGLPWTSQDDAPTPS